MSRKTVKFEIIQGETEAITYSGKRQRKQTVLLKVGRYSISWRAFQLGMILVVCQLLDGLLTYAGLRLYGVHMEGNAFLKELMIAYGTFTALFLVKLFAVLCIITLTIFAHKRKWIRPLIAGVCGIYLMLAVFPWVYILSRAHAKGVPVTEIVEVVTSSDKKVEKPLH